MPSSGSGSGTPVPTGPVGPQSLFPSWPVGAVTLARYARILGYNEAAFWGVAHPNNTQYACREIWTKSQRDMAAWYLYSAQMDLEETIGYPVQPTWVIEDVPPTKTMVVLLKNRKIIEAGARAETVISANAAVSHATDPATVGPLTVAFTDTAEVKVYYPGSNQEIEPSKVEISGTSLTIWIPRVRLVAETLLDNPATGLDYNDLANFQNSVEVRRVYNNTAYGAELVWQTNNLTGSSESTSTASLDIRNKEVGSAFINPTQCSIAQCYTYLSHARVYYRAGMTALTQKAEDAIIRLAHSKMPTEPCGCDVVRAVWKRDIQRPEFLSRERQSNPFGVSDGAWVAYQYAMSMIIPRARGWS